MNLHDDNMNVKDHIFGRDTSTKNLKKKKVKDMSIKGKSEKRKENKKKNQNKKAKSIYQNIIRFLASNQVQQKRR